MGLMFIFGALIVYLLLTRYLSKYNPDLLGKINNTLHWPGQVFPPLIILGLISSNGPGLWFSMSIFIFIIPVSAISLIIKLIKFDKNKKFILRPILSLLFATIVYVIASQSLKITEEQVFSLANTLKNECSANKVCPNYIQGWKEIEMQKKYIKKLGGYIEYPVTYTYMDKEFTLYLYQSIEIGKLYSAGVVKPIEVAAINN